MSALLAWFYTAEPKLADISDVSAERLRRLRLRQAREEELDAQLNRVERAPNLPRWLLRLTRQDIWPEIVRSLESIDGFTPEELRVIESNLGVQIPGGNLTVSDVIEQMPLGYVLQTARYLRGANLTRQTIRSEPVDFGVAPRPTLSTGTEPLPPTGNVGLAPVDPVEAGESLAELEPGASAEPGVEEEKRGPGRPSLGEGQQGSMVDALNRIQPGDQVLDVIRELSGAANRGSLLYTGALPAWADAWRNAIASESGLNALIGSLGLPDNADLQTVNDAFIRWIRDAVTAYRKNGGSQPRVRKTRLARGTTINGFGLGRPGPTIRSAYTRFHMV